MKIIKYLLFALFAFLAFANCLSVFSVEPEFWGGILAASIPVVNLYSGTEIGYGRIYSHHPNTYIETRAAESEIAFGRAIQLGTTRDQVKIVDGASGVFAGVSMYSVQASKLSDEKYSAGDPVGVGKSGFVTVYVEEAVNAGDPVRVRHTNHASLAEKKRGNFAKTAEAGKTYLLSGARFEKTTAGAGETVVFLTGDFTITADV
jgi:hypothetical protein